MRSNRKEGCKRKPRSPKAGFSLTEYLVGMTLAGMLLAGAIGTLGVGIKAFSSARDLERATQILQHEAETLRLLSWSELSSLPKSENYPPTAIFSKAYGDRFQLQRTTIDANEQRVETELAVFWTDSNGRERSRKILLTVSRHGPNSSYRRF